LDLSYLLFTGLIICREQVIKTFFIVSDFVSFFEYKRIPDKDPSSNMGSYVDSFPEYWFFSDRQYGFSQARNSGAISCRNVIPFISGRLCRAHNA
jgi:hypothetical protein